MNENIDLVSAVFGEKRIIAYRPELRELTKSVTANILLNQIIYRWIKNNRQEFYKFKEPCKNKKYQEGDSWTEELGFSAKEFDNAIKKIGFKLGKTKNYIKKEDAFVIYRRDANGLTWYNINWEILNNRLNGRYYVNDQRSDSRYITKGHIHNNTKNTTKNNINITEQSSASYGNSLINLLTESLKKFQGIKSLDGTIKENRQYCWLFLKHKLLPEIKQQNPTDEYVNKCFLNLLKKLDQFQLRKATNFKYLFYNFNSIIKNK